MLASTSSKARSLPSKKIKARSLKSGNQIFACLVQPLKINFHLQKLISKVETSIFHMFGSTS